MNQDSRKYTNIDYEKDDVIGQINKRFKYSQQGILDDIASSIGMYYKKHCTSILML